MSVSNCNGTFDETAFFIGFAGGSLPDSVMGLAISNLLGFSIRRLKKRDFRPRPELRLQALISVNLFAGFLQHIPAFAPGAIPRDCPVQRLLDTESWPPAQF